MGQIKSNAKTQPYIRAAYDVARPDGLILHLVPLGRGVMQGIVKRHTSKKDQRIDWDAVGNEVQARALHREGGFVTCENLTPKEIGRISPLRFPPEAVESLEQQLAGEGVTSIRLDEEDLAELMEWGIGFAGRVGTLSYGTEELAEATEAVRKNGSAS